MSLTPKERAAQIVAEYEALERYAGAPEVDLSGLSEREAEEAKEYLAELEKLVSSNPLHTFRPHAANAAGKRPQLEFLAAVTEVVAVFAGNRFGKCESFSTRVRMADGTPKAIGNIRPGEWVMGASGPALVTEWHYQGVKPVWRHTFSKKGSVAYHDCTLDHKMLAAPESCRKDQRPTPAGEIGHRWVTRRFLGSDIREGHAEPHAFLLGLLLGDGCITPCSRGTQFTHVDDTVIAAFGAACLAAGAERVTSAGIQHRPVPSAPVRALVEAHDLLGYSHEKRLPPTVDRWDNASVAALIAGLLVTDGSVSAPQPKYGGHGCVSFCSTSLALAEGVKRLLEERFGVYGTAVHASPRPDKIDGRPEYNWGVANYEGLCRLRDAIPLLGVKAQRLEERLAAWDGKRSDGAELLFRGREYLGELPTCDITVDNESHLFVLENGLVTSNSNALIVKALCQALSPEDVPEHLRIFRQVDAPNHGWLFSPKEEKIQDSLKPAFDKWCPKKALKGGSWAKAYNGERKMLTFANDSTIGFKTYAEESSGLGGADLDWVAYDEPPPKGHRNEALMRMARGVREWYAMTPVRVNVAWIRREIWRKRESPQVTVLQGSIHENPTLSAAAVEFILGQYSDTERRSRESGEFMDNSGLVYVNMGREGVVIDPLRREFLKGLEHVWAIDPGIRNAAIVAGGFDYHGVDYIYDEILIQDGTPSQYIEQIDRMLKQHGLSRERTLFAIDPAARQRSQATGDTVQSELSRLGLHTISGVRDREVGQQQIRDRLLHGRLKIVSTCVGLRDDGDEFAYPQVEDGKDPKAGPADDSPYHRLATLRYQVMVRPWYPQVEASAVERNLGWQPGRALPAHKLKMPVEVGPLGALS